MSRTQYMDERFNRMLGGATPTKKAKPKKDKHPEFFKKMLADMQTRHCEECKKSLLPTLAISAAAVVAHILPKRPDGGCPSIAEDPDNVLYLCIDCHTNMDNLGADYMQKMSLYPLIKYRVKQLWDKIATGERKNVPEHLRP